MRRTTLAWMVPLLAACAALAGCGMPVPDTPLTQAVERGDVEGLRSLLAQGADPDGKDRHGLTPLGRACRHGNPALIDALLDAKADPDLPDGYINGWTALMHAIHKNQNEAALLLLSRGAAPSAKAPNGVTPLMLAAGQGNREMVTALLERGADPYAETLDHTTALTGAVMQGDAEIVRALLAAAPGLKLGTTMEDTISRWVARVRGRSEILEMVEGAGPRSGPR